jgi:hypothetical protein
MSNSGFKSKNHDQFLGYEAGQFDGVSSAYKTIALWIEADTAEGTFDAQRYIKVLREHAQKPFISKAGAKQ